MQGVEGRQRGGREGGEGGGRVFTAVGTGVWAKRDTTIKDRNSAKGWNIPSWRVIGTDTFEWLVL